MKWVISPCLRPRDLIQYQQRIIRIYCENMVLYITLLFHYYLEIGYCYEGQGTIISEGEEAAFCQGSISLVAPNLLHATRNENGMYNMWGYLFVDLEDFVKLFSFIDERMHMKICRQLFYGVRILDEKKYEQLTFLLKQIFRHASLTLMQLL